MRIMEEILKIPLRWYSKCYCVANIAKKFALKSYQLWIFQDLRFSERPCISMENRIEL
jgi:hypothetical protein